MLPIYLESSFLKTDISKLRVFKVAKKIRGKTLEDLAIRSSKIVCLKTLPLDFEGLKREIFQS